MNFGQILYQISKALIDFGVKFKDILSYNINISDVKTALDLFGVNMSSIPDDISIISLIGMLGGIAVLVIFVYKLFK